MRSFRTVAILLLTSPLLFYACAHAFPGSMRSIWVMAGLTALSLLVAAAALLTSHWPRDGKVIVGVAYTLFLTLCTPFIGLMAACSTGDCI